MMSYFQVFESLLIQKLTIGDLNKRIKQRRGHSSHCIAVVPSGVQPPGTELRFRHRRKPSSPRSGQVSGHCAPTWPSHRCSGGSILRLSPIGILEPAHRFPSGAERPRPGSSPVLLGVGCGVWAEASPLHALLDPHLPTWRLQPQFPLSLAAGADR